MISRSLIQRLEAISRHRLNPSFVLTDTELDWVQVATLAAVKGTSGSYAREVKSSGDDVPAPLIAEQACRKPTYITIRCVHGNRRQQPLRCRRCVGCHHNWRAKVRAQILGGAEWHRTWMLTLTIPEYPSEMNDQPFNVAQKRWHNFLRRAGAAGHTFSYFRVVELQRRGTPHFHIAINRFEVEGTTSYHRAILSEMAHNSGFGWCQGKTFDLQAASEGAPGVAAYMSKYLVKSEDWGAMAREDGRSIRRYNHSRGWGTPVDPPDFRYSAVPHSFSAHYQPSDLFACSCPERMLINRDHQVAKWLKVNRAERRWVSPLSIFDYLHTKEAS